MPFIREYKPLEEIPDNDSFAVIFTAGPIQGAPNWQASVLEIFKAKEGAPPFVMANPRTDGQWHGNYPGQVNWELASLQRASNLGAIMFWLANRDASAFHPPDRAYAQTSRFELGEWVGRNIARQDLTPYGPLDLVLGIDPGFSNGRYIRHRLRERWPAMEISATLAQTADRAVSRMSKAWLKR